MDAIGRTRHNVYMKNPVYDLALLVGNQITATEVRRLLGAARDFLHAQPEQSHSNSGKEMDRGLRLIAAENNFKSEDLFRPLRVALAGQLASPGLLEIMQTLGKQETLARVDRALLALGDRATI